MNWKPAIVATLLTGTVLILTHCGEAPEPEPKSEAPILRSVTTSPPAPPAPPSPQPKPGLPATGNITTSAPGAPPPPKPPELTAEQKEIVLNRMMKRMAEAQSQGLGGGTVTVNGAWHYSGFSHLAPDPNAPIPARLVAVDVTIKGHNENFDIDDIEIIDGTSKVSYGSDPHVTLLESASKPLGRDQVIPVAPDPLRALLIYAFPKATPKFTLYYWGKDLLEEPMGFEKSGWGLPYPEDPQ